MNTGTMSLMITPDPVVGPAQILLSCTVQDRFILSLVDASGRERNIHFQGEVEADGSR